MSHKNGRKPYSDTLASRLAELREEYSRGEEQLSDLERRRGHVRDTLLRISGAIQVLEELLEADPAVNQASSMPQPAGV